MAKTFEAAGYVARINVVKAQVFLTDLKHFARASTPCGRDHFKVPAAAHHRRNCTGLLVKDTLVEIDLIAAACPARASSTR